MLSSRAHNGKKRPAPGMRRAVRRTMLYEVALEGATPREHLGLDYPVNQFARRA